ncbi:hypothetical protein [Yoonia vestfoldensis]|uniref:TrbJ_Ti: P-type conjugative transfer protein TrbJ n=1 Tax=Yoonia vestfoldensis TaxID=245188 RepID=A0A1Y0E6W9_9RHOB|nr:hypothetical protein [Yoonia vestfoldensis]ART99353.1 TrbJ_Ti: P-type conjugative transfer protein TrbJ [Yoonia vestfoldensis]
MKLRNVFGVTALMSTVVFGGGTLAGTVAGFGGATEWTQLLNNAQLIELVGMEGKGLAQEAQILSANLEQLRTINETYQTLLYNAQTLPDSFKDQVLENVLETRSVLERAGAVARDGRSLDMFLRSDAITDPLYESGNLDDARLSERYTDWLDSWNGALETGLRQAGFTFESVETDAALIDAIQGRLGSEQGQLQALQASNEIAATMTTQMVDLRSLTATQLQQNSIAWGRVLAEQDDREAARRSTEQALKQTIENVEAERDTGRGVQEILGLRP